MLTAIPKQWFLLELSVHRLKVPMRCVRVVSIASVLMAGPTLAGAQERYVRAEENQKPELVITTSSERRIVVPKSKEKWADFEQVSFSSIAISPDGTAVGWVADYPNCCTSYPIPILIEVYSAGQRTYFCPKR